MKKFHFLPLGQCLSLLLLAAGTSGIFASSAETRRQLRLMHQFDPNDDSDLFDFNSSSKVDIESDSYQTSDIFAAPPGATQLQVPFVLNSFKIGNLQDDSHRFSTSNQLGISGDINENLSKTYAAAIPDADQSSQSLDLNFLIPRNSSLKLAKNYFECTQANNGIKCRLPIKLVPSSAVASYQPQHFLVPLNCPPNFNGIPTPNNLDCQQADSNMQKLNKEFSSRPKILKSSDLEKSPDFRLGKSCSCKRKSYNTAELIQPTSLRRMFFEADSDYDENEWRSFIYPDDSLGTSFPKQPQKLCGHSDLPPVMPNRKCTASSAQTDSQKIFLSNLMATLTVPISSRMPIFKLLQLKRRILRFIFEIHGRLRDKIPSVEMNYEEILSRSRYKLEVINEILQRKAREWR